MISIAPVFLIIAVASIVIYRKFFRLTNFGDGSKLQRTPLSRMKMKKPSIADGFSFGGYPLEFNDSRQHFIFAGSTGSGKTSLLLLLMQSVAFRMNTGPERIRMLVYDSKTDIVSKIAGFDEISTDQICILNPMDARCTAWDIAADITNSMYAQEFAETLIPYDKTKVGENGFFFLAGQIFLIGVIEALNYHAPAKWDLRDVLNATRTLDRLKAILSSCPGTEDIVEQHFSSQKTAYSVKATMDTHLRIFKPIAAAWHQAARERESISVKNWIEGQGKIVVMGNNPKAKAGILALNRLFFSEVSKSIRSVIGEAENDQSWIFLDELSELGRLESLKDLLITGRSKGAAVAMGFQEILGLDGVYGRETCREIVGQAQNLAFLHSNPTSSETQKWMSECMGKWEFKRYEKGYSRSSSLDGGSSTTSISERYHIQDRWLPSQFESDLPKASGSTGLTGMFRIRQGIIHKDFPTLKSGWFLQKFRPEVIFGDQGDLSRLRSRHPSFDDFIARDESHLHLSDWNSDDYKRLGESVWEAVNYSKPKSSAPDSTQLQRGHPHPKL